MSILDKFLNAMKLNDDDYDDDDFLDDDAEDDYEEPRPKKSLFRKSAKEEPLDDFDDEADDEPVMRKFTRQNTTKNVKTTQAKPKAAASSAGASKVSPIRSRKGANDMAVCVVKPKSMEDAREITETLLANCTVVLNMEGLDLDLAQRIIDFTSGSCYAINGNLQKISNYIFIITPAAVDVSGDFRIS